MNDTIDDTTVSIADIEAYLSSRLSKKRFAHTCSVRDVACDLASHLGCDPAKAERAALLHDAGRQYSQEEMHEMLTLHIHDLPADMFRTKGLMHAHVSYYIAKTSFGITDREVLEAIRYHTTGKDNLSLLAKIVYLADYIDPLRKLDGLDELFEKARYDFNAVLLEVIVRSMSYVLAKHEFLAQETVLFYNEVRDATA